MKFQYHFFFGIVFTTVLYSLFSPIISIFGLLIIFLSSFLVDVDHYFYYVYKKRNLNLISAYKWYVKNARKFRFMPKEERRQVYLGFYIFHGIEPLVILFFLGFYLSPIFNFLLIGLLFHLFTDLVSEIILKQRIDKISVIMNFFITKNHKNLDEIDVT